MKFEKKNLLATLKKNFIFSQLTDNALEMILPKFRVHSYKLDDIILQQGDMVDGYYLIVAGKARLIDLNHNLTVTDLKQGDGFGEQCIFKNNHLIATVKSSGNLTVLKLPEKVFHTLVINNLKIKASLSEYSKFIEKLISLKSHSIVSQLTHEQKKKNTGSDVFIHILKNNPILGLLPDDNLQKVLPLLVECKYKLGEVIIRQGQPVDGYYVIVKGKARLVDQENNNTSLISLKESDGFGEQSIDHNAYASATVRSSGRLTVLKLPANEFNDCVVINQKIKSTIFEQIQYLQGFISLKRVPLFSKLSSDHITILYNVIEYCEINQNEYIFHKGDYGDAAYVVKTGSIRIIEEELNKTFAICRSGEIIGEISLFKSQPRLASAIAIEDTVLFKISRETFQNILPEIKDFIENIVKNRLQRRETFISDKKAKEKILNPEFVLTEHKIYKFGGANKIPCVKVNHESLAGMACINLILDIKKIPLPGKWRQYSINKIENKSNDTFIDMSHLLEESGLFTRKVRILPDTLQNVPLPAIIMDEQKIPQVIYEINHRNVICSHPLKGFRCIPRNEFNDIFDNEILLVSITPEFRQASTKLLSIYRRFFEMILQYNDILYWILTLTFLLMIFGFAAPFFTQIIMDKVLIFNDKSLLHVMLFGMICVTLFQLSGGMLRQLLIVTIFQRIESVMNAKFFNHILLLRPNSYEKYNVGEYITRFNENRKLIDLFSQTGMTLTMDVCVGFFYFCQLFIKDFFLSFIGLVFIFIQSLIVMISSKKLRENDKKVFNANTENESFVIRMLTGIQSVKSLAGEDLFYQEGMNKISNKLLAEFNGARFGFNLSLMVGTLSQFSTIAILLFGAYKVINQELSLGEFLAFNAIFGLLLGPIGNLTNIWDEIQEIRISIERINDILELPVEGSKEHRELTSIEGHILIENLCFRYDGMERDVLSNINLEILPGQKIAFVGRSGCGKSTLIHLIMGFFEPESGSVYIDNKNVNSLTSRSILSHMGIVEQKPKLFSGTIKDNIAISDSNLSIDMIHKAASISGVKDIIDKMPLGLETYVGEGGSGLSGGEAQKVAIARAIVREPKILILDEATSALDNESEGAVMENLKLLMEGKTTISIAHRLSTIVNSDMIVVLDEGKIVETGTHEELIKKKTLYHHLFMSGHHRA
ncbi:MAG: peptidase domain-containing ABC transporter [Candidatus Magnetomorum sp.]|nr:peptidase domain-containing ABC transporter [Candidatus Magnetomorum sp.]